MLTVMLLVANLANTKCWGKKPWKITETLAYGHLSKCTQWEPSDDYQHDRV